MEETDEGGLFGGTGRICEERSYLGKGRYIAHYRGGKRTELDGWRWNENVRSISLT